MIVTVIAIIAPVPVAVAVVTVLLPLYESGV